MLLFADFDLSRLKSILSQLSFVSYTNMCLTISCVTGVINWDRTMFSFQCCHLQGLLGTGSLVTATTTLLVCPPHLNVPRPQCSFKLCNKGEKRTSVYE